MWRQPNYVYSETTGLKKDMQALKDQLTVLQGLYQAQSCELALAQNALETLKSANEGKLAQVEPAPNPTKAPNNASSSSGHSPEKGATSTTTMSGPHMSTDINQNIGTDLVVIEPNTTPVNMKVATIQAKLHYRGDVRGVTMSPLTSLDEFVERITAKFGTSITGLRMEFTYEDGTEITLCDESHFELAIETARVNGKLEDKITVSCVDVA